VYVPPIDLCARVFFRSVAAAELHAPMLAFDQRRLDGNLGRLRRKVRYLEARKLEQLEAVEATLALEDAAHLERFTLRKCQLTTHDVFADGLIAGDRDGTELRGVAWLGGERQRHGVRRWTRPFERFHARVGIAVLAQEIDREIARGGDQWLFAYLT